MGDKSAIEWTDATWNPIRGCSRVSEGCRNCYAERVAARFSRRGQAYEGLARSGQVARSAWTGAVRFIEDALMLPLRWKAPRRVFVNSMSDLFHEKVEDEWIDRIFAVMALTQRHTYQILTKRPERMRAYLTDAKHQQRVVNQMDRLLGPAGLVGENGTDNGSSAYPLVNVWCGTSVEDQATAEERIPVLLQTPAAVRWASYEPALGPVDFNRITTEQLAVAWIDALAPHRLCGNEMTRLDWIVVGGESGPGARPFDLAWARSTIMQCRAAGVPVFVKQLGTQPMDSHHGHGEPCCSLSLRDRKGGNPDEWPADLRVREFPG